MTGRASNSVSGNSSRTNKFLVRLILVVLLSLISWSFFYVKQMPLAPAETSVVVGFWLLVVFGVQWMIGLIGRHQLRKTNAKGR